MSDFSTFPVIQAETLYFRKGSFFVFKAMLI